ncbi:MAG: hypothetical protein LBH96_04065 [Candidatus Peribacteria bacterium]|jgi:hypothetical protein|nr:hypothetical protein [Candidatus Peribacteria bacterium]
MISFEDAKNTLIGDSLLEQEEGYNEYFRNKISRSLADYHIGKNPTTPHKQAMT